MLHGKLRFFGCIFFKGVRGCFKFLQVVFGFRCFLRVFGVRWLLVFISTSSALEVWVGCFILECGKIISTSEAIRFWKRGCLNLRIFGGKGGAK